MQRSWIIILALALAGIFAGCKPREREGPSERWLQWHFAGTAALTNHSTKLPAVAALPASKELGAALVNRIFAELPKHLASPTNAALPDCTDLFEPLLQLALQREHIFEVHGEGTELKTLLLAVHIEKEQVEKMGMDMSHLKDEARLWEKNYRELITRLGLPKPKRFNLRYCGGWYATKPDKTFVDFLEMGRWVIVGIGKHRQPMLDALERINQTGDVAGKLGDRWASLEADFTKLSPAFGLPFSAWQRATLDLSARGENVVINGGITLTADTTTKPGDWAVPTNLIRDPLISFTALRATPSWLGQSAMLRGAGYGADSQAFFWAQAQIPFHSYAAMSVSNGPAAIQSIATTAPEFIRSLLSGERGRVEPGTNQAELVWKGLPIIAPRLRATNDAGRDFLMLTLFPGRPQSLPVPAELLAQLNRDGLVYYDWEITGDRLAQWKHLLQVWNVIQLRSLPQPAIAQQQWLDAVGPLLGNTVTEVTLKGARELAVARKGHTGFTAFELAWLAGQVDEFIAGPRPTRPQPPGAPEAPALPAPPAPAAPK